MTQWTPLYGLKMYGRVVARKMFFIALGWEAVYWISQPCRRADELNVLMLFAPLVGAFAGLVVGWYMATDAPEDSGMTGLPLWVILVAAACAPIWAVEGLMAVILPAWRMGFGGWMVASSATILAMATAVWHASSQG